MEHMNIFYRIFHEDLHPLAHQRSKEFYIDYFRSITNDTFIYQDDHMVGIESMDYPGLKHAYYKSLFTIALREIKRALHQKLFSLTEDHRIVTNLIQNYQILVINYMKIIEQEYLTDIDRNLIFQVSKEILVIISRDSQELILLRISAISWLIEYLFMSATGNPDESVKAFDPRKNHLFIVGIDKYEHATNLENCVSDAEAFIDVLLEK